MQLHVDPFVEANRPDLLSITGTRSEREAVERVNNLLVLSELTVIQRSLRHSRNGCEAGERKYESFTEESHVGSGCRPVDARSQAFVKTAFSGTPRDRFWVLDTPDSTPR